jgi:YVTN family beta-propeller protein
MFRQALFGVTLLAASGLTLDGIAQKDAAAPQRPPVEIPLARLQADAKLPIALEPGAVASEDAVWTMQRAAGAVVRIQAKDNAAETPIVVGAQPCASLIVAFDTVWIPLCGDRVIARPSVKDKAPPAKVRMAVADADGRIATGVGSVWIVSDRKGVLSRIDPDTNQSVAEIYLSGGASSIAFGEDALWATSEDGNLLTRVNPHNNEIVERIVVGPKPGRLAIGEGAVWTLNRGDGSVTRVDPKTNKVVATIAIGSTIAGGEIAAGEGSVWISAAGTPIVRIDPRTNRAVQRFTGDGGGAILIAHGSVWVAAEKQTWRLDPKLAAGMRP